MPLKQAVLLLIVFCFGFCCGCASTRPPAAVPTGFNILLISIDTLRSDQLGAYNPAKRGVSPNIDAFASESVLFQNSFSNGAATLSSHFSMFTGLFPTHHEIWFANTDFPPLWSKSDGVDAEITRVKRLKSGIGTLTEYLKDAGFQTAWFAHSRDPFLDTALGLGRRFDSIHPLGFDTREGIKRIGAWLKASKESRFFGFLHTKGAHGPYSAVLRKEFSDRLRDDENAPQAESITYEPQKLQEFFSKKFGGLRDGDLMVPLFGRKKRCVCIFPKGTLAKVARLKKVAEVARYVYCPGLGMLGDFSRIEKLYDVNVSYADRLFGELLDEIKAAGLYDRTIIILTSDHGESLFEHETFGHGNTLYDELLRVPLLVRVPGLAGHRITTRAQGVDLLPTVLDILHLPPKGALDGRSLLSLIHGKADEAGERLVLANGAHKAVGASALYSKNWKLISSDNGARELYDLQADPKETQNLASRRPDLVGQLLSEITRLQLGPAGSRAK